MASPTVRTENIHIRAATTQKTLLEQAAVVTGKSLSQFILDSATDKARATLLDQTLFMLDQARWDLFITALDAPVVPNENLRNLLATPAPWEAQPK